MYRDVSERLLVCSSNEADAERLRQKKAYEHVINARDILGTQLIRRNDELALLYEKIKIQQSTLAKGEVQYRQRLEDIALLKVKINDERRQLYILKRQVKNIDALKAEMIALEKELMEERTKVKALSEELENPMNVHVSTKSLHFLLKNLHFLHAISPVLNLISPGRL